MFIVQSGPIRRSLVAFSTATLAEEEETAIIFFPFLFELSSNTLNSISINDPILKNGKRLKL
jgi:hypothetical protein